MFSKVAINQFSKVVPIDSWPGAWSCAWMLLIIGVG